MKYLKNSISLFIYIAIAIIAFSFTSCSNNNENSVDSSSKSLDSSSKEMEDTLEVTKVNDEKIETNGDNIFINQKISDFKIIAEEKFEVKEEVLALEGMKSKIFNVYENREKLFSVEPDDIDNGKITRIWVYSDKYKTDKGIGIGSSLLEIKNNYAIEPINKEMGLIVSLKNNAMNLVMSTKNLPQNWRSLSDDKIPNSISVEKIIITNPTTKLSTQKEIIFN